MRPSSPRSLPWQRCLLAALVLAAMALAPRAARAADPLDPKAVPEPLKPWAAWVLEDKDDLACAAFLAQPDVSRCAWPARLDLDLGEHGGRFTQRWHLDAKRWIP